jgi:trimethylamine--corrinoid protein Co-methyltransferase
MGRFYGLPAQASVGGTDAHLPGAQAGAERALGTILPVLAWPDLLVGPGLLGGSTILSPEQLLLDIELFRRCVRLRRGMDGTLEEDVVEVLDSLGPGSDFLARPATRRGVHDGEWHMDRFGVRDTWERWEAAGRPDIVAEARLAVAETLASHRPLPMDEATAREVAVIVDRAAAGTTAASTKGR